MYSLSECQQWHKSFFWFMQIKIVTVRIYLLKFFSFLLSVYILSRDNTWNWKILTKIKSIFPLPNAHYVFLKHVVFFLRSRDLISIAQISAAGLVSFFIHNSKAHINVTEQSFMQVNIWHFSVFKFGSVREQLQNQTKKRVKGTEVQVN